jgi:hypothetical protein
MRCMACGAEMTLVNVAHDDTMAVPGFEHQTFVCPECQDVEQRLVFTKQDSDGHTEAMPERTAPVVVPASTAQDEHVAASGFLTRAMAPAQTLPIEQEASLELRQTAPLETTVQLGATQTVPVQPTIQSRPPLRTRMNVWTKALEKLQAFKERAIETERRAQFDRVWDSFRSVYPSSASSEAVSRVNLDEPVTGVKKSTAHPPETPRNRSRA